MGSLNLTKKERIAARSRVKKFRAEFASKPEHNVVLDIWYGSSKSYYEGVEGFDDVNEISDEVRHCGTVGCVGGYLQASPLYKEFLATHKFSKTYTEYSSWPYYAFFGVTEQQGDAWNLFNGRVWRNSKPDKAEALARIDRVIKFHTKKLEG